MLRRLLFFAFLLILIFIGCKTSNIPEKPFPAFKPVEIASEIINDTLSLRITNKIKSPIQIRISSADSILNRKIQPIQTIVLPAEKDSLLEFNLKKNEFPRLEFQVSLGDPQKRVILSNVGLPIPKNKAIRVIQGHYGAYSHDQKRSRFAIDFDLKIGDTIFAAFEGYAVLVIEGNTHGGKDKKWFDYANKIIIYNPETGLFFQYSHLKHNGAIVEQGDWVLQGQPIGLSGMTGYTDLPHLHFNVLVPVNDEEDLISVPVDFVEGYRGKDLQKNVVIKGIK